MFQRASGPVRPANPILGRAFVAVVLLMGAFGCRSASSDLAPSEPAAPGPAASDAAAPPSPTLAEGPPYEAISAADADTGGEPAGDDNGALAEDEPTDAPQAVQKEALDLCQSAKELFDGGKVDEALAATDHAYELMLSLPANGDDAYLQGKEDIRILVAGLIDRIYRSRREKPHGLAASWDLGLPITTNAHVQREIESFTTGERDFFLEGYRRSGAYRPMILAKLASAGLPSQLSWLPLVESWFKVRALSRASALGMWQFIASTGLRYGLDRDAWVDERLDPNKSADAAVAYLSDLHAMFGDWAKALAAYNCGEARVMRLQRRSQEYQDFWDLYEALPLETRRYVPRLFAALRIIENPSAYGMSLPQPDPPLPATATVDVARAVRLDGLDSVLGLEKGTLAALNPELRHGATPTRAYGLRVPEGAGDKLAAVVASLPEWKPPTPAYVTHRVRSGESLSVIARKYGTSVSAIMRVNGLRAANRIRAGQRLRIPVRGTAAQRTSFHPAAGGIHIVRRGESLASIAGRYGTSVSELRSENGLHGSLIRPGQRLRIPGRPPSPSN
jgi:peptidoglycan lytic transglycosylase D